MAKADVMLDTFVTATAVAFAFEAFLHVYGSVGLGATTILMHHLLSLVLLLLPLETPMLVLGTALFSLSVGAAPPAGMVSLPSVLRSAALRLTSLLEILSLAAEGRRHQSVELDVLQLGDHTVERHVHALVLAPAAPPFCS